MPRRIQVRQACLQCRKRRIKCDGQPRCSQCELAGSDCTYYTSPRESKSDLRSEIERLRAIQSEHNVLFDALSTSKRKAVLQALAQGESRHSIAQKLVRDTDVDGQNPAVDGGPNDHAPSPPTATRDTPGTSSSAWTTSSPQSPTTTHAPSAEERDPWLPPGRSKKHTRRLLDSVLAWDFTSFCVLSRHLFTKDFDRGFGEYCSKSLVTALLCLAGRISGPDDETASSQSPSTPSPPSDDLFDEVNASLRDGSSPPQLPGVQAIGVLSLYQVSCGRDTEAQKLAEEFASAIADLCRDKASEEADSEELRQARANTYIGAITLNRILRLVIGPSPALPNGITAASSDLASLDGDASGDSMTALDYDSILNIDCPAPDNPQFVAAKIGQLTQWVYRLQHPAQEPIFDEAVDVYVRSLEWYSSFMTTNTEKSSAPFMVSAHMYLQFCVIALFSPFASTAPEPDAYINPREISAEAARNILDLAQSYDSLFAFGNPPGLVPYFIAAARSCLAEG